MRDLSTLDWRSLLARLAKDLDTDRATGTRDEEAWAIAAHRIADYARRVGRWDVGLSEEELEDIGQDLAAKLQTVEFIQTLLKAESAQNYLFATIRNRAQDLARAKGRRSRKQTRVRTELYELPAELSADELLEEDPLIVRVRAALETLSPADRDLLHRHYWLDQPVLEIAQALGIKYSAAAVRVLRARERLRKALLRETRS